jgi:glycosyltransferase involved in cell wall biosynthesis
MGEMALGGPSEAPNGRLLVISPVRNEAAHLDQVVAAMAAQERPADLWLIVDDGSSDGTAELAEQLVADVPFARLLRTPEGYTVDQGDRNAAGGPPRAWTYGFRQAASEEFEFVAKLDGDIVLPPEYLSEMLRRFREQPELGIAGGAITELREGVWWTMPTPKEHPTAPARIYRLACLEAIGGMPQYMGADVITGVYARMHGYTTLTFEDLPVRHLRPMGSAQGTRRGLERHGRYQYVVHYGFLWIFLRSFVVAVRFRPYGLSGIWLLTGYLRAALGDVERVPDADFAAFAHGEQRARAKASVARRFRRLFARGQRQYG